MKFVNFRYKGKNRLLILSMVIIMTLSAEIKISQILTSNLKTNKHSEVSRIGNNSHLTDFEYSKLFRYIGDRSFICIILLYFQSSPLLLFLSCFLVKALVSYYCNFISWKIFDVLPEGVFQIVGMSVYLLLSFSILYNLMFHEEKLLMNAKAKKKEEDFNIIDRLKTLSLQDFDVLIKITGIILISLHEDSIYLTNETLPIGELSNFTSDCMANIISILVAMLIGFCLSMKFSLNCNLLFTSITFLIMGVDICLKFFTRGLTI